MKKSLAISYVVDKLNEFSEECSPLTSEDEGYQKLVAQLSVLHCKVRGSDYNKHIDKTKDVVVQLAAQALRFLIDLC